MQGWLRHRLLLSVLSSLPTPFLRLSASHIHLPTSQSKKMSPLDPQNFVDFKLKKVLPYNHNSARCLSLPFTLLKSYSLITQLRFWDTQQWTVSPPSRFLSPCQGFRPRLPEGSKGQPSCPSVHTHLTSRHPWRTYFAYQALWAGSHVQAYPFSQGSFISGIPISFVHSPLLGRKHSFDKGPYSQVPLQRYEQVLRMYYRPTQ